MGGMGWQGWACGRGPTSYVLGLFRGLQVFDRLVESYVAVGRVTYVLGRLRGRCWGDSVDDDGLIFCRPFGRRTTISSRATSLSEGVPISTAVCVAAAGAVA